MPPKIVDPLRIAGAAEVGWGGVSRNEGWGAHYGWKSVCSEMPGVPMSEAS